MNKGDVLNILSDKKVLCADDNINILNEITEILEIFFNEVNSVNDGIKALKEAKNNLYDVLVFDISMPNMDGLEAIKNIRRFNKKIPIIILSAHAEHEYLWRAVDLKITKYLTKPFEKKTLIKALKEVSLELVNYNVNIKITEQLNYNYCTKQLEEKNTFIQLSKSESRLLEYFIEKNNEVIIYDAILDYMWDYDKPSKEAIKAIVKELRKKIGTDSIKNIYGLGYKFEI